MRKTILLLAFFSLFCLEITSLLAQNNIGEKLEKHQQSYHFDKIYVSHNQPYYTPGDTLYGKVYLVNGRTHTAFEGRPIVYLNFINPENEISDTLILKINDARANFSIPLPSNLEEGRYLLRAYTLYQKNFDPAFIFQKEIKLIGQEALRKQKTTSDEGKLNLQFFPEGGDLVYGLTSKIAFEARNGAGAPLNLKGAIYDEQNKFVTIIKTVHEGIGVFNLKPELGKKYIAKITRNSLDKTFKLPTPLSSGFSLMANARSEKGILIQIKSSISGALASCTIIGHIRGQVFLNEQITNKDEFNLNLERAKIPSGVVHFTLFDQQDRPVCERLVFNKNPLEVIPISINLEKETYEKRSLVKAKVKSDKSHFNNVSVSIYNKSVFPNEDPHNLQNYLWLQSDLKGKIRNINQYFERNDVKTRTILDYLLMTQGWRRFNWKDVLEEKPVALNFPKEEHLNFTGQITKLNAKKEPVKADIMLSVMDPNNMSVADLTTDESGLFQFSGFDFETPTQVFFQANRYNEKKKSKRKEGENKRYGNQLVNIQLLDISELEVDPTNTLKGISYNKKEQTIFANEVERIRKVDTIFNPEWKITLQEVDVKARRLNNIQKFEKKMKERISKKSLHYSRSSVKIYMDSLPDAFNYIDIFAFISGKIPGTHILETQTGKEIAFRRHDNPFRLLTKNSQAIPAIFEVDGIITPTEVVTSIPLDRIEIIDVKKRTSEVITYGKRARGGVITIITKENYDRPAKKTFGILNIMHTGYHQARQFYIPNYATTDKKQEKPDYRTCLYWNPDLKSEDNHLDFEFYTGDKFDKFLIFLEGINEAGIPFVGRKEFVVGTN